MILQQCTRCNQEFLETTASFHRRTKDIFNPWPCICKDCLHVIKAFNPEERELEIYIKGIALKNNNQHLKRFITNVNKNENIIKYKKKEDKKRKLENRNLASRTRAKRKGAYIDLEKDEKKLIRQFYNECMSGYHVDHIIPLSKGGKHCLTNLQYLKSKENIKKSNNITIDILEKFMDGNILSIAFLQRKFKMTFKDAQNILMELGLHAT